MKKLVYEKMGIKPGMRTHFVNATEAAIEAIDLPELDIRKSLKGKFEYIHLFVTRQSQMHRGFPVMKKHLQEDGVLWVSWPKAGQQDTDLTLPAVIKIGYDFGLVESKCISIDSIWSALKFTFPRQGKVYNNSYGKLK
ncbi:MAG: hypothetical protein EOO04_17135 [Chitinophagaceae bacterium]|nr:MAG: hypothetical protein EOO04_17135 [Chitinophagaceae bacterium]